VIKFTEKNVYTKKYPIICATASKYKENLRIGQNKLYATWHPVMDYNSLLVVMCVLVVGESYSKKKSDKEKRTPMDGTRLIRRFTTKAGRM
jgi:hypothetical protein